MVATVKYSRVSEMNSYSGLLEPPPCGQTGCGELEVGELYQVKKKELC
jgi:hypothetical protein